MALSINDVQKVTLPVGASIVVSELPPVEISEMPAGFTPPSAVQLGRATVTTATTPVRLTATPTPLNQGVQIVALPGNSGVIYVGGAGVSSATGYPLSAGDAFLLSIDDLSKVWIDASTNAQSVAYHYV